MIKNYLKIALRNILKNKGYAFINISGLAIGMGVCLLIAVWVMDELSYDRHHPNSDRIYRIVSHSEIGGVTRNYSMSPPALAPAMASDLPEVEGFVRIFNAGNDRGSFKVAYQDRHFEDSGIYFADPGYFKLFNHEFIRGNPQKALTEPKQMVIVESVARKLFGDEDPLGKPIKINDQFDQVISAVIKDTPTNSHFRFKYMFSIATLEKRIRDYFDTHWIGFQPWSYILVKENVKTGFIQGKLNRLFEKHSGEELKRQGINRSYSLQKLTDIHLTSHLEYEIGENGNMVYVYLFSIIAIFVLLIACINFINLSTARSTKRAREVGVRKVFGAHQKQLIFQFLGESLLMSVLAMGLGIVIFNSVLPLFNDTTGKTILLQDLGSGGVVFGIFGMILFSGILAGSFPAFVLSSFKPVKVMKGNLSGGRGEPLLRKSLVVFQFSISIFLIIGTIFIYNQLQFMRHKNLGFDKSQLMVIRNQNPDLDKNRSALKAELLRHQDVESVSFSNNVPGRMASDPVYHPEGKPAGETHRLSAFFVDHDYLKTFKIDLLKGRDFSETFPADADEAAIINETLANNIGWGMDAVGKRITEIRDDVPVGDNDLRGKAERRIIGIIKDFHHQSLRYKVTPTVLLINKGFFGFITLKVSGTHIDRTILSLRETWKKFDSKRPMNFYFLDQHLDQLYCSEERTGTLFLYFACLAIFVGCLGLFGLASFTAEQKFKEIGIRKVLGCSVPGVVSLLTRSFAKWVILGNLIAWPAAYFVLKRWLQNFAYQTPLSPEVFVFASLLALIIALMTVIYQSLRAALSNPVDAIRNE